MNNTNLERIWHQVPPNYYQDGVKNNLLQKLWHTRKLAKVIRLINEVDKEPKSILDVGCSSGWFLSQLSLCYPRAKMTGVDIYKSSIEYGKHLYPSMHLLCADAHKMPFADKTFDVIVCTEVLEHVLKPEQVLQEIRRVLKPDGIAIIEMDTGNFLFRLIWHWWTNIRRGVWRDSHIHAFNTEKLESIIKRNGFLITKKQIFNWTMAVVFRLQKK